MLRQQEEEEKIVNNAYDLYLTGHMFEMKNLFNSISSQTSFRGNFKLKFEILRAYIFYIQGKFKIAKQIMLDIISLNKISEKSIYLIDAYILLIEVNLESLKFEESFELIEKTITLLNDITINTKDNEEMIHRQIWLIIFKGRTNWRIGKNNEALNSFEEALKLSVEIQNQYDIGISSRNIALIIIQKDKKHGQDLQLKALQIFREINNPFQISWSLQNLGVYVRDDLRNYDQALKYLQEGLEIREKSGNKHDIWYTLVNIGQVYEALDNTNKALEFYNKCLSIGIDLNNSTFCLWSYEFILGISIELGDIEKTENILKKVEYIAKELGYLYHTIYEINFVKAHLSSMKGRIQDALEFMDKAASDLLIDKEYLDDFILMRCYLYCITYSLKLKNQGLANSYLQKIKINLEDAKDNLLKTKIGNIYALAEAMILKESLRIKEKAKAQEFLELAINNKNNLGWYKEIAIIQLCELYLEELEKFGDPQTLIELNNLVITIQEKAKLKNSIYLLIKAMIIRAKLQLVEGELKGAEKLLEDALTISQDKNIKLLENEVNNELKFLNEWKINSFEKTTVQERIQKSKLTNYIKEAQQFIGFSQINLDK